jgi:2,3-bisphosphoglycerate-dependent phosphoglycerate mutase
VDDVTRLVLVRHGEARCNVDGVIGGVRGCTGLTADGRGQAARLARRLSRTGELGPVAALYSSVLPRAVETAAIVAPALTWADGEGPGVTRDCALCELHPGDADGLTWDEYSSRFAQPDWDADPSTPIAPGGEGWTAFVGRAAAALERVASAHPGGTVVVVTHAGVVEASMLRFLPVDPRVARLGLHTAHASMTVWLDPVGGSARTGPDGNSRRWRLERYNDATAW